MADKPRISASIEDIMTELKTLRKQFEAGVPSLELAGKHSDWGVHGRWSNSSAKLPGDIGFESKLSVTNQPTLATQIDKLIADASSANLTKVAENLSRQLGS